MLPCIAAAVFIMGAISTLIAGLVAPVLVVVGALFIPVSLITAKITALVGVGTLVAAKIGSMFGALTLLAGKIAQPFISVTLVGGKVALLGMNLVEWVFALQNGREEHPATEMAPGEDELERVRRE